MGTVAAKEIQSWRTSPESKRHREGTRALERQKLDIIENHGRMLAEKSQRLVRAHRDAESALVRSLAGDQTADVEGAQSRVKACENDVEAFLRLPELIDRAIQMRHTGWGAASRPAQERQARQIVDGIAGNMPRVLKALRDVLPAIEEIERLVNIERADFGLGDTNSQGVRTLVPETRVFEPLPVSSPRIRAWLDGMADHGW